MVASQEGFSSVADLPIFALLSTTFALKRQQKLHSLMNFLAAVLALVIQNFFHYFRQDVSSFTMTQMLVYMPENELSNMLILVDMHCSPAQSSSNSQEFILQNWNQPVHGTSSPHCAPPRRPSCNFLTEFLLLAIANHGNFCFQ